MAPIQKRPLDGIFTVAQMVEAFRSEEVCRRLLEQMVWPKGRICPFCGSKRSIALRGRDCSKKARPGLYQCQVQQCRPQFTAATKTPMHATKLPLRIWLTAMWLQLHSDKGVSSPRLAEAVGVTQKTAWRIGHAIRLMTANSGQMLGGVVEADEVFIGGKPKAGTPTPDGRRRRPGETTKWPVLAVVERSIGSDTGEPPGAVRTEQLPGLSAAEVGAALNRMASPQAHLMSDGHKSFRDAGTRFSQHDTVTHAKTEYVRGIVHVNSTDGLNDRSHTRCADG